VTAAHTPRPEVFVTMRDAERLPVGMPYTIHHPGCPALHYHLHGACECGGSAYPKEAS
jgi:hypothetical protein